MNKQRKFLGGVSAPSRVKSSELRVRIRIGADVDGPVRTLNSQLRTVNGRLRQEDAEEPGRFEPEPPLDFFENTVKEIKRASLMNPQCLAETCQDRAVEHIVVFEHGRMTEILCPWNVKREQPECTPFSV